MAGVNLVFFGVERSPGIRIPGGWRDEGPQNVRHVFQSCFTNFVTGELKRFDHVGPNRVPLARSEEVHGINPEATRLWRTFGNRGVVVKEGDGSRTEGNGDRLKSTGEA